jgi:rhamnogalacturonyl hydrolase YesR
MRIARHLSISYLAALASLTALPLTGCQNKAPAEQSAATQPTATASAAAPQQSAKDKKQRGPLIDRSAEKADAERFAAKIAANIAKVPDPKIESSQNQSPDLDNAAFRSRVVGLVRKVAEGPEKIDCDLPLESKRPFRAVVWAYRQGEQVARGEGADGSLCVALKGAARQVIAAAGGDKDALAGARLVVDLPDHNETVLEFEGKGLELVHGLVPPRSYDKALLAKRIDEGKNYLMRVFDPEKNGVHKYYYAPADKFEPELHTIYTASTALTLLKLHAYGGDKAMLDKAKKAADFMLSMQSHDEKDHTAGGFFYTYDMQRKQPERKLVVGTASKSIFTLLELHALTKDKKYLDAATLSADWLVSMQRPDGSVRSYLTNKGGERWMVSKKESMLYTGQVLSALSRVHRATGNVKYLDAAAQTAGYLAGKVTQQGCWLGDEYRKPNPISSSWVILSLLDFVKATADEKFESLVLRCAGELIGKQRKKPEDIYRHGRWQGSLSSSGTGWLAEVYSELFLYCKEKGKGDCDKYKEVVVRAIRQIMQYTYTPESSFMLKNPEAASGGVFWSVMDRYVRTDAVCHAMNAYIHMMPHLGEGALIEIPERSLAERMALASETPPQGDDEDERDEQDDPEEPSKNKADDTAEDPMDKAPPAPPAPKR